MRGFKRLTALLLLVVMTVSVMALPAFAYTQEEVTEFTQFVQGNFDNNGIKRMLTTDSSKSADPSLTFVDNSDPNNPITYYVKTEYIDVNNADPAKKFDKFWRQVNSKMDSEKVRDDTIGITEGLEIEANTGAAMETLEGFVPYVNILLGIVVVLITLGLAVFTSFDVCYIVFPIFRNKCEDAKVSGQGPMVKKSANGGTQLRFVSDEAQYAVNECTIESGKNPLTAYFAKRVWAYIIVSIILFILLTGNITIITNLALKVVSYIMDVISTLG